VDIFTLAKAILVYKKAIKLQRAMAMSTEMHHTVLAEIEQEELYRAKRESYVNMATWLLAVLLALVSLFVWIDSHVTTFFAGKYPRLSSDQCILVFFLVCILAVSGIAIFIAMGPCWHYDEPPSILINTSSTVIGLTCFLCMLPAFVLAY
jgi:uncharacterized oligopeptide transporter (OPT) family protein